MSFIIDKISDIEIDTQGRHDPLGRLVHLLARDAVSNVILPICDPAVRKKDHDVVESLKPLSHDLPRYIAEAPYYDTVLPQLIKFLLEHRNRDRKFVFSTWCRSRSTGAAVSATREVKRSYLLHRTG